MKPYSSLLPLFLVHSYLTVDAVHFMQIELCFAYISQTEGSAPQSGVSLQCWQITFSWYCAVYQPLHELSFLPCISLHTNMLGNGWGNGFHSNQYSFVCAVPLVEDMVCITAVTCTR